MERPGEVFDREQEWADLVDFATQDGPGARLALLYGRRRQGKSFLLRRLVSALGGFYHQALEEERTQALDRLAAEWGAAVGVVGRLRFADWLEALRAPLMSERSAPSLVALDEFPYLLRHSPELPSALQRLHDESRDRSDAPAVRVILCGSTVSVMTDLLSGTSALRGRATVDLALGAFDYRQAARFWGIGDPETALLVHSVVGGTPGYKDLLRGAPGSPADFTDWLATGVLNPSHALFREADYLLTEDPRLTDRALYHSVLTAVSAGNTRPAQIGAVMGRDARALAHPLRVLETAGLVRRDDDLLLQRRPTLSIADPIVRFAHLVIRPRLAAFEDRRTAQTWAAAQPVFDAGIVGPAFEQLAREWTSRFADPQTLDGEIGEVGRTVVNDRHGRTQHEVDVVVLAAGQRRQPSAPTVLALGEAKASRRTRTITDLARLDHVRGLLTARGVDAARARLVVFGRSGFDAQLRATERRRDDVVLVDLDRLYSGN